MPPSRRTEEQNGRAKAGLNAGHPLFPIDPEKAQTQGEIAFIYLERNGETCPEIFAANDLQDYKTIVERFGGGKYLLRARDSANARWTASHCITLPGAPRPFVGPSPEAAAPDIGRAPPNDFDRLMAFAQMSQGPLLATLSAQAQQNTALLSALVNNAKPADNPLTTDIVKMLLHRAQESNPADPAKMLETMLDVFQSGAEFRAGIEEGRAERRGAEEPGEMQALLGGAEKFMSLLQRRGPGPRAPSLPPQGAPAPAAPSAPAPGPTTAALDAYAAAVSAARAEFGAAASDLNDAEVVQRWAAKKARAGDA